MEHLRLDENRISDIKPIRGLINLQILHLQTNQISNIEHLKRLANLRELWLQGNLISYRDIQSLKSALSNCSISF